jgi:hypothetical protein
MMSWSLSAQFNLARLTCGPARAATKSLIIRPLTLVGHEYMRGHRQARRSGAICHCPELNAATSRAQF